MKNLFIFFSIIFVLPVSAQTFTVDGVNYSVTTTTVEVYLNPNYTGDLILPETVDYLSETYSVTSISNTAFSGCTGLTSLTIPDSVTSIGNSAFFGCTGLTSLNIGNSVTSIGSQAFEGCSGLTSLSLPNSLTSLSTNAFIGCSGLTSLSIGNSLTFIGHGAFSECSGLTSVTIPNSVTSIGISSFRNCTSLSTLNIGDSVTYISASAFSNCTSLATVNSDAVTPPSLGSDVFENINQYTCALNVPSSSLSNYQNALVWQDFNPINGIQSLFYIFTVNGVTYKVTSVATTVEVYLNPDYTGDLILPQTVDYLSVTYSVTSISNTAFSGNTGLTSVTIPDSVTSIGNSAFFGCTGLTSLNIGNSVTSIGSEAFKSCNSLTSLSLPNSLTSLSTNAFIGCSGLTSLSIGNSLTFIGHGAFYGCSGLTSVTIPNSVTSIGISSFGYCTSLSTLNIGNSVTNISASAFSNCTSLATVNSDAVTPPSLGSDVFENVNQITCALNVPPSSLSNYQNAIVWQDFNPINGIQSLFYIFTVNGVTYKVTSVATTVEVYLNPDYTGDLILPQTVDYLTETYSVTSISDNAFDGCTGLTSLTIPDSVTSIGIYSFRYCTSLSTLNIGNSVTSIGSQAFNGCISLTSSLSLPNSLTSLGSASFAGCTGLTSLSIGNSLTFIGHGAFSGCSGFTSITIPNSVTSIGNSSFGYCTSLSTLNIGNSVTNISSNAFSYCTSLAAVNSNAVTPPSVGSNVFENVNQTTCALNVPSSSLSSYQNALVWQDFNPINVLLNTVNFSIENKVVLYPNPASTSITLQLDKSLELEKVNFYNTLGQLIKTSNLLYTNVSDLAKGIYYLEVITNQGKTTKTQLIQ